MNAAPQGKSYPPVAFVVDAERVEAFARAVSHRSDGVPPTIVTAPEIAAGLANVVRDPELGIDLARVLHSEQEYEWSRSIGIGETLSARSTIERIRSKGGTRFVTLRTELRDASDQIVVVGRSTLLVREGP